MRRRLTLRRLVMSELGSTREVSGRYLDLQLNPVRVKPPINHMAAALIQTFRGLNGLFGVFCTTDHDALLKTPVDMPIDAEQILECSLDIAHGFVSGCYRLLPSHRRQ